MAPLIQSNDNNSCTIVVSYIIYIFWFYTCKTYSYDVEQKELYTKYISKLVDCAVIY